MTFADFENQLKKKINFALEKLDSRGEGIFWNFEKISSKKNKIRLRKVKFHF